MSRLFVFLLVAFLSLASHAQYMADWTYQAFYEEINSCRSQIVGAAYESYRKHGQAAGQSEETLREDLISMTPVFEYIASPTCYCALNELAKDIAHSSYVVDRNKIAGYMQGSVCKQKIEAVSRTMSKEQAQSLRLTTAAADCLKDGQSVTLTGKVWRKTFPGRPHYESTEKGDEPETVWVLTLDKPVCVTAESMEGGHSIEIGKLSRFQLVLTPAQYQQHRSLLENRAEVKGQLFQATSGHHHTKALIDVKEIKAATKK